MDSQTIHKLSLKQDREVACEDDGINRISSISIAFRVNACCDDKDLPVFSRDEIFMAIDCDETNEDNSLTIYVFDTNTRNYYTHHDINL